MKSHVVSTQSADGWLEVWSVEDPAGRTYFELRLTGLDGIPLAPRWLAEVNSAMRAIRLDAA